MPFKRSNHGIWNSGTPQGKRPANRVLDPEELLGGSPFVWDGEVFGDVYIDDLVLLVIGAMCAPPPLLVDACNAQT